MSLRILHTADWHIGQTFHEYDRTHEHQHFLHWLVAQIHDLQIDVLLVSGDIFDGANPSAQSQKLLYDFLRQVSRLQPPPQVLITAGNHDSAARLEAPNALLAEFNTTVVGVVHRTTDNQIDFDRLLVPLYNRKGERKALCMAVPYLRMGDYPPLPADVEQHTYGQGIAHLYNLLYQHAIKQKQAGEAIVAMGHLYAANAKTSDNDRSERVIGGVEAVPSSAFDAAMAYTALGHIHKAQSVGSRNNIRYCGSPLPMSFSEIDYQHRVVVVDIDGETVQQITEVTIPVTMPLLRVPPHHKPLNEVLEALATLPEKEAGQTSYLEVRVLLTQPEPAMKHQIEEALKNKNVLLARIDAHYNTGKSVTEKNISTFDEFRRLHPQHIFNDLYRRKFDNEVPADLKQLFDEVVNTINLNINE